MFYITDNTVSSPMLYESKINKKNQHKRMPMVLHKVKQHNEEERERKRRCEVKLPLMAANGEEHECLCTIAIT